jgi:hypothetical protein
VKRFFFTRTSKLVGGRSVPDNSHSIRLRNQGEDHVRAALRGTRFESIECLREAVWATRGHYEVSIAEGTSLRHDHGSQFISHAFQGELKTLGIE